MESTSRALLIGNEDGVLDAIERSLDTIAETLELYGFTKITRIEGTHLPRDSLLAALGNFLSTCQPGDRVVVYYLGHGHGFAKALRNDTYPSYHQYLVCAADPNGARGLLGVELASWIEKLAGRCAIDGQPPNLTVILDCCFGAQLLETLKLPHAILERVSKEIEQCVIERSWETKRASVDNIEFTVLTGSVADARAYVRRPAPLDVDPRSIACFTEQLAKSLTRYKDHPVSWDAIIHEVRANVQRIDDEQHPVVEGARYRVPFTLEEKQQPSVLRFHLTGEGAVLDAGLLSHVCRGDSFKLFPLTTSTLALNASESTAEIVNVDLLGAKMIVDLASRGTMTTVGYAVRDKPSAGRGSPVALSPSVPRQLRDLLHAEGFTIADENLEARALATVNVVDQAYVVTPLGRPSILAIPTDTCDAENHVLTGLLGLLHAEQLVIVASRVGYPPEALGITWGHRGDPLSATPHQQFAADDRFEIRIENTNDSGIHYNVLEVTVDATHSLRTGRFGAGVYVNPAGHDLLGQPRYELPRGLALNWPQYTPRDNQAREGLVLVIISEMGTPVHNLGSRAELIKRSFESVEVRRSLCQSTRSSPHRLALLRYTLRC